MKLCCINGCKEPAATSNGTVQMIKDETGELTRAESVAGTGVPLNHGMCLLHLASCPAAIRKKWAAAKTQADLDAVFRDLATREWAPAKAPKFNPYSIASNEWSTT